MQKIHYEISAWGHKTFGFQHVSLKLTSAEAVKVAADLLKDADVLQVKIVKVLEQ